MFRYLSFAIILLVVTSTSAMPKTTDKEAQQCQELAASKTQFDKAIEACQRLTKAAPDVAKYHYLLALAMMNKMSDSFFYAASHYDDVLHHLDVSTQLDPDLIDAWKAKVSYYLNAPAIAGGSVSSALEVTEELQKINDYQARLLRFSIFKKEKEYSQATNIVNSLVEKYPQRAEVFIQKSTLLIATKQYHQAVEWITHSERKFPENPTLTYLAGKVRAITDSELETAAIKIQKYLAIRKDSDRPSATGAYWRLGTIYQKLEQFDKAKQAYKQALSLYPDNELAKEALDELEG